MDVKHTIQDVAEMLWGLFTDGTTAANIGDPSLLAEHGMANVTHAEIEEAYAQIYDRLPPSAAANAPGVMDSFRSSATASADDAGTGVFHTQGTPASPAQHDLSSAQPAHPEPRNQPASRHSAAPSTDAHSSADHHHSGQQTQPAVAPSVAPAPVTVETTTIETTTIVNNTYFVTDNRVITEIKAEGDVEFDQTIENHTVNADDGAVAVGGDLTHGVVNTGTNSGIMAGDDAIITDSVVGDGNTQVNDSEVGAISDHGDALNVEGAGNVNTGSGDVIDVESGGDTQVVSGHGNDVTGDVDVAVEGADGPVNVAVGDDNAQAAVEDDSTTVDGSFNTDQSVEDVGNTLVDDSLNTAVEDNDASTTSLDGSFNAETHDNDLATYDESLSQQDASTSSDDDSMLLTAHVETTDFEVFDNHGSTDLDD